MKKLSLFISIILFSLFITKLFAGKHYASGKARVVDGDTIVIKKTWKGILIEDINTIQTFIAAITLFFQFNTLLN